MPSQPPPAFRAQARVAFWRKTPPALFPSILGLVGLGMAWRKASGMSDFAGAIADLILGAVALLMVFAVGAYVMKMAARPKVLLEDLGVLPGRAGVPAMVMAVMLMSAALVPLAPGLAAGVMWVTLAAHTGLAVAVIWVLATGPAEQRLVTPAWHLSFVGFIVGSFPAQALGMTGLATGLLFATMAVAAVIYGVSLAQIARRDPPAPLRPMLAIHLAPVSLFATMAHLLGLPGTAMVLAGVAALVFAVLLVKARYLTAAGFSPLWGAFTFPMVAFAGMVLVLSEGVLGGVGQVIGALLLVAATLVVPWIAAKVVQMWIKGALAAKTNAAVA